MEPPQNVRVSLGERSYDIEVGSGNLADVPAFFLARKEFTHAVVITDDNVDPLVADPLGDRLTDEDIHVNVMVVDPGETSKSIDVAAELWEAMLEEGADRQSVVIAVGGGVVGDLAGFVAAAFARGLTFFQVPTTLLAQVDSSVGGKTGVNLPTAKNMVGAFWQPAGVLIDVATLGTLPEREYRAGLAEVVKYGVILDAAFFEYLEQHADAINSRDEAVLVEIVRRCCRLKADVVEADERETSGLRSVLNYGHTFCHAIEAATDYEKLLHGEAVAIGMHCAARLAERLGRVDEALVARQHALLDRLQLPTQLPPLDAGELIHLMRRDKKAVGGHLRFVLPTRLGHVELVDGVKAEDVRAVLE